MNIKNLSTNDKNNLRRQAANRILAGFGYTHYSVNYGTTYGFSLDNLRCPIENLRQVTNFLDKENIQYKVSENGFTWKVTVSSKTDNLEKFFQLGEDCWKKVVELYTPMLDKLEEIQKRVDSAPLKSKMLKTNYLVNRNCFAEHLRKSLLEYEIVENYEQEIEAFEKLIPVQNNIEAVKKLYKENKHSNFNPRLEVLLTEEYERLTGEDILHI